MPFKKFKKLSHEMSSFTMNPMKESKNIPTQVSPLNVASLNEQPKVFSFKPKNQSEKEKQFQRNSLTIENVPVFSLLEVGDDILTFSVKEYPLELLPWLIKKDSLFKVNLILGVFVSYLELIKIYGLFPLHPNMMRVNEQQEVAVWINKNFSINYPDQVISDSPFSRKELLKKFIQIFKCCLPCKNQVWDYEESDQLLSALIQLKKKEEVHKNCHQFIKYHTEKQTKSRASMGNFVAGLSQTQVSDLGSTQKTEKGFVSTRLNRVQTSKAFSPSVSPAKRSTSFSPYKPRNLKGLSEKSLEKQKIVKGSNSTQFWRKTSIDKDSQKNKNFESGNLEKSGELFKKYLMFSSTKYQKINKTISNFESENSSPIRRRTIEDSNRDFIFQSDVKKLNGKCITSAIINTKAEKKINLVNNKNKTIIETEQYSPFSVKRKMSSGQNLFEENHTRKFFNSGQFRRKPRFEEKDSFAFQKSSEAQNSPAKQGFQRSDSKQKEKLKSSFPYKTASTLTSFRFSNYTQKMNPSRSDENLPVVAVELPPQPRQIEELGVEEDENEFDNIENDFNNIFSATNSHIQTEEEEKQIEMMISEFEDILF